MNWKKIIGWMLVTPAILLVAAIGVAMFSEMPLLLVIAAICFAAVIGISILSDK